MGYIFNIWLPFFNGYFWFGLFYVFIVLGLLLAPIRWREWFIYVGIVTLVFLSTNYIFFVSNNYPVLKRYDGI
jgi:hypothetical protein